MKAIELNKNSYIELVALSNLYSEPDKNDTQRLLKTNIQTRLSLYIDDIQAHEEYFDSKGKISKSMCKIYHRNIGPLVVNKSYDYISKLKQDQQSNLIGFKHK